MTIKLTEAQARKLGIETKLGAKRTVKRNAKGDYHTVCKTCGEHFQGHGAIAREDAHLRATHHARYALVPPGQ
jgi:hypothetical protein